MKFLKSIVPQFDNKNKPYTLDMVLTLNFKPLLALRSQSHLQDEWRDSENLLTTQLAFGSTQYFPNLRFITVSGLKVEADSSPIWGRNDQGPRPCEIRLLNLSGLRGIGTSEVASCGACMPLLFLDLSRISVNPEFTRQYSRDLFPNLRILKLRGLHLSDGMLPGAILWNVGRLWSLDLSDNKLTDRAVDLLIDSCSLELPTQAPQLTPLHPGVELVEEVPGYTELPPGENDYRTDDNIPLRPDHEEEFIVYMQSHALLTQHVQPILDVTDDLLRSTGVTQLYIDKNKLTVNGIYSLLNRGRRLQVLDAGSVICSSIQLGGAYPKTMSFFQPDTVHPILYERGSRIEVLRIHHSIVTYCPTIISSTLPASGYSFEHLFKSEAVFGAAHQTFWVAFVPSNNHRIRELTLTAVPSKSYGMIIEHLKNFITDAAQQEAQLLKDKPKSRRAPRQLSGLRKLTLEMMGEDNSREAGSGRSASGDKDADTFAQASEEDYSFFSASGVEKLSIAPKKKTIIYPEPKAGELGLVVLENKYKVEQVDEKKLPVYSVLGELVKFRAEMEPKWSGKICVVIPGG